MIFIPNSYLKVLRRRNFLILTLTILSCQLTVTSLFLTLIVSVFAKTHSNFGVSGVIVSSTLPSLLFMAFTGVAADIFDRKKIMILSNLLTVVIIFLIIFSSGAVVAAIPLSFLFFASNTFFGPASSASSAQLVRKDQLLSANSIFFFTIALGSVLGISTASVVYFFFGRIVALLVCQSFSIITIILSSLLPPLFPTRRRITSVYKRLADIGQAFIYIFRQKTIWFFFLSFAFMQGIISFGVTLAPGFFDKIIELPVEKSPILILPLIGLGVLGGALFMQNQKIRESFFVLGGMGLMGLVSLLMAFVIKFKLVRGGLIFVPISLFLFFLGFSEIISLVASRTVLQKRVSHRYQGTVFGAVMIASALSAFFLSPVSAILQVLLGYINLLIFLGLGFLAFSFGFSYVVRRWNF